jgi:NAD(P)-dependent dehydrogenase (short-subunit alcohol dehydrogenase family)
MTVVGAGVHVVMACRSVERAEEAISDVHTEIERTLKKRHKQKKEWTTFGIPQVQSMDEVSLEAMALDLSDLVSVRSFVNTFLETHHHLHYLILNAGSPSSSLFLLPTDILLTYKSLSQV